MMKRTPITKKITSIITIASTVATLVGCNNISTATSNQKDTNEIVDNTQVEESTSSEENSTQSATISKESLAWQELGSLNNLPDFRAAWDKELENEGEPGSKTGMLYLTPDYSYDNNNTLHVAIHNSVFKNLIDNEKRVGILNEAFDNTYVDADELDGNPIQKYCLGINAYFNLLPDSEAGYCNSQASVTRAQAMSTVMRAITKVDTSLTTDSEFSKAVGESEYNLFAQKMNDKAYISTKDGSLSESNYNTSITTIEAIYLLVNTFFPDDLQQLKDEDVNYFEDVNYGEFVDTSDSHIKSLQTQLSNEQITDKELRKALYIAYDHQMISEETHWNEAITKAEFMEMLVSALLTEHTITDFNVKTGTDTNKTEEVGTNKPNANPIRQTYTENEIRDGVIVPDGTEAPEGYRIETVYKDNKKLNYVVPEDYIEADVIDIVYDAEGPNGEEWYHLARANGADGALGWSWIYNHGEGAGDGPTYAIYMKEGSELYGKRFELGEYLPDGNQLCGTLEEYQQVLDNDVKKKVIEDGLDYYYDEDGSFVIKLD